MTTVPPSHRKARAVLIVVIVLLMITAGVLVIRQRLVVRLVDRGAQIVEQVRMLAVDQPGAPVGSPAGRRQPGRE
ncbi:hypothetical protein [Micromonospora sp. DT229]|uniref:hypothetical protein n=1 Tax=Micromonospora sp. DT229 TaxID=3393430 RepID=UPI003CEFEF81